SPVEKQEPDRSGEPSPQTFFAAWRLCARISSKISTRLLARRCATSWSRAQLAAWHERLFRNFSRKAAKAQIERAKRQPVSADVGKVRLMLGASETVCFSGGHIGPQRRNPLCGPPCPLRW